MQGAGAVVGGFCNLTYEVGFADPGSLLVGEDDGDEVIILLEMLAECVDVGGGLVSLLVSRVLSE